MGTSGNYTAPKIDKTLTGFDLQDYIPTPVMEVDESTRTFTVSKYPTSPDFSFYVKGKYFSYSVPKSIVFPDVTGTYYFYFDDTGTLDYAIEGSDLEYVVYEQALVGLVYWNATTQHSIIGVETHGFLMDAATHYYNHVTFGARCEFPGLDIAGLSEGGTTYAQTYEGNIWDEDIQHNISDFDTHEFLYREGSDGAWVFTPEDNKISYKKPGDTYHSWNEFDGSTWKLTEGASDSDFWIVFMVASTFLESEGPIKKIIGQNAYPNKRTARAAIETEKRKLQLDGLPSPEIVFLYAWIVKRDGTLVADSDGSLYYDLRSEKGGVGSSSPDGGVAANIGVDTTNFDGNLSATDSDVQAALETIDDLPLGGGDSTNTETLTADKTLTVNDAKYQFLSATSTLSIILPANPPDGTTFFIKNNNSYNNSNYFNIKNSSGEIIDRLFSGAINGYVWQGSYWKGLRWGVNFSDVNTGHVNISLGFGSNVSNFGTAIGGNSFGKNYGAAVGYGANGQNYGAVVGYYAKGDNYGAAVGRDSAGNTYGVGIGYHARGNSRGVAVGYISNTNTKYYSNAIGYYSETERYGETSFNIDGQHDQENNQGLIGLTVDTTNNTPTIMLAGGTASQRAAIRPKSIMVFDIQIAARDETSGDCAAYQITGAIKRNAIDDTVLVGTPTKTVIAEDDTSWDVAVTADDTNEALQIEVTGDDTNTVQWVASVRYTETHF